jgi:hypothetical protein
MFDPSSLTLAQLETIEAQGVTLADIVDAAANLDPDSGQLPPARFLIALHYMSQLEQNPDATWEDSRNVPLSALAALVSDDDAHPEG